LVWPSAKGSFAEAGFRSRISVATCFDRERCLATRQHNEANMPFLFWMPMIVMCGLWRAAEEDARTLFPTQE